MQKEEDALTSGGRKWMIFALLSSLLFGVTSASCQTEAAEPGSDAHAARCGPDAEQQLVAMINKSRSENGLSQLIVDARLSQTSRKHTELMVQNAKLSHQFPGEPSVAERFDQQKLPWDREGENVAMDTSVASAHRELMGDPPHRRRILDPDYNALGIAVICSGNKIFVTEDFARLDPEHSQSRPKAHS
jgi:uncharacterized protein YkwD